MQPEAQMRLAQSDCGQKKKKKKSELYTINATERCEQKLKPYQVEVLPAVLYFLHKSYLQKANP